MSVRRVARTAIPALLALARGATEAGAARRDRTSPTTPANPRITATTLSSVTLTWDASKPGSGIACYTVLEKSTWTHFNVPAPQTGYTRTRLWPNINHAWIVYAVDTTGNRSGDSNTVTYRTPSDVTPPSTPALSAPFVGPTRVELDWTDSVDDVSSVTYTVNVDGSPVRTGLSHAVVQGLSPSTSYAISVTARDSWGNAATSNMLAITTPTADNSSAPTAPGNLRGFESSGCEAWLSWDTSTDDVDPQSAIRYDAYVKWRARQLDVRLHVEHRVRARERDEQVHDGRRRQRGQRIGAEHTRSRTCGSAELARPRRMPPRVPPGPAAGTASTSARSSGDVRSPPGRRNADLDPGGDRGGARRHCALRETH